MIEGTQIIVDEEPATKGAWRYDPEAPGKLVSTCDNPDCAFCLDAIDDETGEILNPPNERYYAEWALPILASDTTQYTCQGCGKVF